MEALADGFEGGEVAAGLLVDACDGAHGGVEVALAGFALVVVGAAVLGAGGVGEAEAGAAAEDVFGGGVVGGDEVVEVLSSVSAGWAGPPVPLAEVLFGLKDA